MITNSLATTMSFKTMPHWLVRSLDIFNGTIAVYIATFGALSNVIALVFFNKSRKDLISMLYIAITFVDLITCILMIPIGVTDLDFRKPHLFFNRFFCNGHGYLWNVTARLTVFLVMILSITRTVFLLFPFKIINKKTVVITIIVYAVIQCLQASVPFLVS